MSVLCFFFQLPLVLQIPRLLMSDNSVCLLPYSLLGFGDILVPGTLLLHFPLIIRKFSVAIVDIFIIFVLLDYIALHLLFFSTLTELVDQ